MDDSILAADVGNLFGNVIKVCYHDAVVVVDVAIVFVCELMLVGEVEMVLS